MTTASMAPALPTELAAEYPFSPRTFEHGGYRQSYVDEGPPDGEVLLFVHGNPTWSFLFRRQIDALRERYRCVAPDHVGCGLSDKPKGHPYSLTDHVENLVRLVDALALERVTLVLHDWGGAIGFGLARRRPDLVARIAVANTAAFPADRIPLRIAACRVPVFGRLAVRGLNAFARAATHMAVERPLTPRVRRGYLHPYADWNSRAATHEFVLDIPLRAGDASWDELVAIEADLGRFTDRPFLILWGERDWCFTPRFREEWQRRFPAAEVERYDDAGHYVFEDASAETTVRLARWLEGNPLS